MKSRRFWSFLGAMALGATASVNVHVNAKPENKPETSIQQLQKERRQVETDVAVQAKRYRQMRMDLSRMAQRLEGSDKPEDRRKAQLLNEALKLAQASNIEARFERLLELLKRQDMNLDDITRAFEEDKQLVADISAILKLLLDGDTDALYQIQRRTLQQLLKDLKRLERDQTLVRNKTQDGANREQIARDQERISKEIAKIQEQLGGASPQEAKPGEVKPAKPSDQVATSKPSNPSEKPSNPSEKPSNPSEKPSNPSEKPSNPSEKPSNPSEKPSNPSEKPSNPSEKPSNPSEKPSNPSEKPSNPSEKPSNPSEKPSNPSKPGEPNASEPKPSAGGDSNPGDPKPGSPSSGAPSTPKPNLPAPPKPSDPKEQDPNAPAIRPIIDEAKQHADDANTQIPIDPVIAVQPQNKTIDQLKKAQARVEEILKQLREEEMKRRLATLLEHFRKMAEMQERVMTDTVTLDRAISDNADHKPNRGDAMKSVKLSDEEGSIVDVANHVLRIIEGSEQGDAVQEALHQVRSDMLIVKRRLGVADVGTTTQRIEQDIIDQLKDVIESLKEQLNNPDGPPMPPNPNPNNQQPPKDPDVIKLIQEIKIIRNMQKRVNDRTRIYGEDNPADANAREELEDLSQRQKKIAEITKKKAQEASEPK